MNKTVKEMMEESIETEVFDVLKALKELTDNIMRRPQDYQELRYEIKSIHAQMIITLAHLE